MNGFRLRLIIVCVFYQYQFLYAQCGDTNPITPSDLCNSVMTFDFGNTQPNIRYCSNHSLETTNTNISRAVIWLHGSCRNAQDKYNDLLAVAGNHNVDLSQVLIVTPQFLSLIDLNEPGLNLDGSYLYWTNFWNGWKYGYYNQSDPQFPTTVEVSSFSIMDSLIRRINAQFPNLQNIVIGGHSAGGQFMNRYAASNRSEELFRNLNFMYIVSNPATYLYFDMERVIAGTTDQFAIPTGCNNFDRYKYGLSNLNGCPYISQITPFNTTCQYRERKVAYLLGENDTNSTSNDCRELIQGQHRLERGIIYHNYLQHYYGAEITNRHHLETISGIGHSSGGIMNSTEGRYYLFDWPGDEVVSLDCSCHQNLELPGNPNINAGSYSVDNTISASGTIQSNETVNFNFGSNLELIAGFSINQSAILTSNAENCPND